MIDFGWIADHTVAIAERTGQHVELAAIALAVGFALSFGLALGSRGRPRLYAGVAAFASIVYTIPSFALFALLVAVTGISLVTVEIPLVLYTFVIYIRNIVLGFESVPDEVRDAADGMGLTSRERFRQVELPLAVPLIIAGVRLASVSTLALVTITATLGITFGGLGFFIFERPFFVTEVLVGVVGSIALAVLADVALTRVQRRLTPWANLRLTSAAPDQPPVRGPAST